MNYYLLGFVIGEILCIPFLWFIVPRMYDLFEKKERKIKKKKIEKRIANAIANYENVEILQISENEFAIIPKTKE